ncbi:RNA-binding domain-containing protein [Nemania sp. FL0031]|nr:RNA-binding domain-containing protein [Nemania sp. FL0031]
MHCVRRAALRAVCSSSRFVAVPRQQVAAIALQASKSNAQPMVTLPFHRYFSQTAPVAEEQEKDVVDTIMNDSVEGSGESNPTLESSLTENERVTREGHSIFISNMTFDATDVHLQEAFGKYGEILRLNIARDGRGLSRGFGFITFSSKEAANRAIAEANDSFWHGRRITVAPRTDGPSNKTARGNKSPTNSLYIGNIPYEASDADLNQMFRSLENVTDVRVAVDRNTGWPRGFAHADFKDVESAQRAHEVLSSRMLGGRQLRIDFAETRNNTNNNNNNSGSRGLNSFD